ncbi:MAG: PPC domain-containing protein [Anaerolineae bacterium]|nr:PPC domain-containing protein [Anaerolineae bacterium]
MLRWLVLLTSVLAAFARPPESRPAAQLNTQTPRPLAAESPMIMTLAENETIVFSYLAEGSQTITVSAKSLEETDVLDPMLEVVNPDGTRLAINDDRNLVYGDLAETDALINDLVLPEAGDYRILVRTFSGTGGGRLQIALTAAPPPVQSPVSDGSGVVRILIKVPDYGVAEYAVQMYAGQRLSLSARSYTSTLDPILELLNPQMDLITENDDHGDQGAELGEHDSYIGGIDINEAGIYIARVRGFGGAGGDVELMVERETVVPLNLTPPLREAIVIDDKVAINDVFEQEFDAEAGDLITVTVEAQTVELDPRIAVVDAYKQVIETGERIEGNSNLPVRIERLLIRAAGHYIVQVRSYLDTEGGFKLTILHEARDVPMRDPENTTTRGELSLPGEVYSQSFNAQEGDYVTIQVRSLTPNFDPRLRLLAPNGDTLAANDDHGSSDPSLGMLDSQIHLLPITADGTYTLQVTAFDANPGLFDVTVGILR